MLYYTARVWSGTTLQSPSGVGTIPLSPSGVGNCIFGVGPVFGEWMEWSPRYGVEIWSGSGGYGVVVWEWNFKNAHSHTTFSTPTSQSPTPPISNQSPINQIQQSAVTRTACQFPEAGRGVAQMMWAQLIRHLLEWGLFAEVSQHGTTCSAHFRPPTELFCYDFWSGQN